MKLHSHRSDLTARVIELPLFLAGGFRSQRELIEHFKVDRKTIKRDAKLVASVTGVQRDTPSRI
ncbi:MAG: hypothetical protein WKF84_12040 [Pyrinomonadaceae bacterium]